MPIGYHQDCTRQEGVGVKNLGLASDIAAIVGLVFGPSSPEPKTRLGIGHVVSGISHGRFPTVEAPRTRINLAYGGYLSR
jgi:hypothetical protein